MALTFLLARTKDISLSFVPDGNPNLLNPPSDEVFEVSDRVTGQSADQNVKGVSVYIRAVDENDEECPGARIDFVWWAKDDGASQSHPGAGGKSRWIFLAPETDAPSSAVFTCSLLGDGWVQILGGIPAGAKRLQIWAASRVL